MFKQYKLRNYKFILVMYVMILNVIGILLIGSAKPSVQSKQILGMIAGLTIMVMLSLIDYNFILKFSWLIYFFMIGVLLLVMFAGDDAGGAQRWFEIGSFRFQPSELAKILIILFFAYFFMKHEGTDLVICTRRHTACPYFKAAGSLNDNCYRINFCCPLVCCGIKL